MPGFDICSWTTQLFVAGHNMTNINQRISPDSGHLIFTKEILGDNCYPLSRGSQGGHHYPGQASRGDNLIHDHYLSHGWSEAQSSQENAWLTPDCQRLFRYYINLIKTQEAQFKIAKKSLKTEKFKKKQGD